jgi:hypothetical protein
MGVHVQFVEGVFANAVIALNHHVNIGIVPGVNIDLVAVIHSDTDIGV